MKDAKAIHSEGNVSNTGYPKKRKLLFVEHICWVRPVIA